MFTLLCFRHSSSSLKIRQLLFWRLTAFFSDWINTVQELGQSLIACHIKGTLPWNITEHNKDNIWHFSCHQMFKQWWHLEKSSVCLCFVLAEKRKPKLWRITIITHNILILYHQHQEMRKHIRMVTKCRLYEWFPFFTHAAAASIVQMSCGQPNRVTQFKAYGLAHTLRIQVRLFLLNDDVTHGIWTFLPKSCQAVFHGRL